MRFLSIVLPVLIAATAAARTSPPDTLDIYGGPGTLEGKFQTATGEPDSQGWIGVDETAIATPHYWSIATYNAANLDPGVPDNRAWWCGLDFPSCGDPDLPGGYGNSWNTALRTTRQVNPSLAATVTLHGVVNVDLEPGYDFLLVEAMTAGGEVTLLTLDGHYAGEVLDLSHTWQPGDYVGEAGNEVVLRLHVTSDVGWSDEDCSYPTAGALQADNLQLVIEQPGLPVDIGPVETCEPGETTYWEPVPVMTGAGNFAQLWTGLDDMDPDQDNHSPQWAFLDDGLVVPGVGPTYCWVKCYGPDSLVVNHDHYTDPGLGNSILSPPIALPDDWTGTLHLSYDAYIDPALCFPVCVTWGMLATDDPAGLVGWSETWDGLLYYRDGTYGRYEFPVPDDMVPPTSRHVRIKLQARHTGMMCWGPMDSPAPYLDNVRLQMGPKIVSDVPEAPPDFTATAAPNPFNPAVVIRWNLPRAGDMAVRIHDARGRLVRVLRSGPVSEGAGNVTWRGRNNTGQSVAAGVYFCRLQTATGSRILKLTLLK